MFIYEAYILKNFFLLTIILSAFPFYSYATYEYYITFLFKINKNNLSS